MIQTEYVVGRLRELAPDRDIHISVVSTHGDRDRQTRLDRLPGIGVFVKELEEAILDGRIDLAVHSLKDLPTELPDGLALLAVPEREDPADILVARAPLDDLPAGARIGTGSLRRAVQLRQYRPDLEIGSIRGNVDTRLRKVTDGEIDGLVSAAAALTRMGLEDRITQRLPADRFVPAVGQGALGIEGRSDNHEAAELASRLTDATTWRCIAAERAFLAKLGGGCRAPIAALATVSGARLDISGMVADPEGKRVLRAGYAGDAARPAEAGIRLAKQMADMGAAELISEVTTP